MTPQRTCLGCRKRDDQHRLLRLVRRGDEVVDGTSPRLAGRGAYLHEDPACLGLALRRRGLQRALGGCAGIAPPLAERLEAFAPGWIRKPSAR